MSQCRENLPANPYGAVYYRVSNPPKCDWERDYQTASEDGINIFRHWFLWSAIERTPGVYTWDDYDRQLDLAAKNGIKTIIAEMVSLAPEWTVRLYPHARIVKANGSMSAPAMHGSCATGFVNMCLDNDDLRERGEAFLKAIAERYRNHPGLGGYDIWNECNYVEAECYCEATVERFRTWLRRKYGEIEVLRETWKRFSLAVWEDVVPPRNLQPYADSLDWLAFRRDDAYRLMRWRSEVLRQADPDHAITAHGLSMSLRRYSGNGADDWRAASLVESYGLTWGSSRHGDEPWKQPRAFDLIRAASHGKPFWHAEAYGGPLWMAQNVLGKPRDEGRICYPEDIRYWNLTSYMHGAVGTLYLRWRPLLDGQLFGAFGPYGMDGSRTPRSEMSAKVAAWIRDEAQRNVFRSKPVRGEVGILFNPDAQDLTYLQRGDTGYFGDCYEGAYRGFFDNNIQADFVHPDDLDEWDFIYFPFPVMIRAEVALRIGNWVKAGGILVCEGCPGYWGDRAHVGSQQPNLGLDELFGADESYVEFTPDLLHDLRIDVLDTATIGGLYLQAYEPTTGKAVGWYDDGRIAAVENRYGDGKTLLIGTMPGHGYTLHNGEGCSDFFRAVFGFSGKRQRVSVSDRRVRARLHDGEGGRYLWIANPTRSDISVVVILADHFSSAVAKRGPGVAVDGDSIRLDVPARDVCVYLLE